MMDTRSRWLPVLVLASLGLTACGDDTDDAPDVVSATGPGTVTGDLGSTAVRDVPATESPVDPEPPASTGASGVNGEVGQTLDLLPVVETTWATWKRLYPQTIAFPFSEMGERASINETVNGFDVLVAYERTATWPSLTRVRWTAVF